MTSLSLLLVLSCCAGSYSASWSAPDGSLPGGVASPREVAIQVEIESAGLGGSYAAVPGPAPGFDGTPCPDIPDCYDVTDSFWNRGRAFVSPVGRTGQIAVRFEVSQVETPDRIGSFFWGKTFVLSSEETEPETELFSWPAMCPSGGGVECVRASYADEDLALNAAYGRARERLPARVSRDLRERQRRWIGDRDATCSAARRASAQWAGELAEVLCLRNQTQRRTYVLQYLQ